jgi:AcrR family transcriptional regulator
MPEQAERKPAHRKPRTARGEATRRKLLAAAELLFGRNGFHGTAVGDLTREAGVGHGTFYLYFASKEDVFRELVRYLSHELRKRLRAAVEGVSDRVAVEELGMRTFLQFVEGHRDLYRIVLEAEFVAPEMHRWYYERLAEGYAAGLEAAMDRGEIARVHPETLAYSLMGIAHFMGVRWVVWEGREPPEEVMTALMSILRATLSGAPGSGPAAEGGA